MTELGHSFLCAQEIVKPQSRHVAIINITTELIACYVVATRLPHILILIVEGRMTQHNDVTQIVLIERLHLVSSKSILVNKLQFMIHPRLHFINIFLATGAILVLFPFLLILPFATPGIVLGVSIGSVLSKIKLWLLFCPCKPLVECPGV